MPENKELTEVLEKFNCGNCHYLGRSYNQCKCCFGDSGTEKSMYPDIWHPVVCKNHKLETGGLNEFGHRKTYNQMPGYYDKKE